MGETDEIVKVWQNAIGRASFANVEALDTHLQLMRLWGRPSPQTATLAKEQETSEERKTMSLLYFYVLRRVRTL